MIIMSIVFYMLMISTTVSVVIKVAKNKNNLKNEKKYEEAFIIRMMLPSMILCSTLIPIPETQEISIIITLIYTLFIGVQSYGYRRIKFLIGQ